jgi:hypothetical protein
VNLLGWKSAGCLFVVIFLLAFIGLFFFVEIPFLVAFGWIFFLIRTVPNIQPDWSAIGLAAIALALLVVGIHRVGSRWMLHGLTPGDASLSPTATKSKPGWKMRWTANLVAVLFLVFTAGISVVGMVHQLVWMTTGSEQTIYSDSYEFGGRIQSRNNLKQIGLSFHNYNDSNKSLPAGGTFTRDGQPLHGAMTMILPFIEQNALFESIDIEQPWNSARNRQPFESSIPAYQFPPGVPNPEFKVAPGSPALTNYAGNVRVLRLGRSRTLSSITDGTSNTVLFGEVNVGLRPWGDPLNLRDPAVGINQGSRSFGSPFRSGAQLLLVDGSVRFVSESISPTVLKTIATPDSGETVEEF